MDKSLGEPKYFRCRTCDRLLTDRMIRKGACAGHRDIRYATSGSLREWILIKLHLIR